MAEIIEEKILRNKNYVFRNRAHAGELLAIPSGGVPVGKIIAKELGLCLQTT